MDISKLREPLPASMIDFRVQSVNKGGYATILAYKDARADMNRLDAVVGPLNWERQHSRENHNCIVSIWDESKNQWISKEDTGTESMAEAQKGLASDSFKRACFNWGIGRELYDMPEISVKLKNGEYEKSTRNGRDVYRVTYKARFKEWKWTLIRDDMGRIVELKAVDYENETRFCYSDRLAIVEWTHLIIGYARNDDGDALLTEFESKQRESNDFVEAAWGLMAASTRAKLETIINDERRARDNG